MSISPRQFVRQFPAFRERAEQGETVVIESLPLRGVDDDRDVQQLITSWLTMRGFHFSHFVIFW